MTRAQTAHAILYPQGRRLCHGTASDTYRSAASRCGAIARDERLLPAARMRRTSTCRARKRGADALRGRLQAIRPTAPMMLIGVDEVQRARARSRQITRSSRERARAASREEREREKGARAATARRAAPPRHTFIEGELTAEKDPLRRLGSAADPSGGAEAGGGGRRDGGAGARRARRDRGAGGGGGRYGERRTITRASRPRSIASSARSATRRWRRELRMQATARCRTRQSCQ